MQDSLRDHDRKQSSNAPRMTPQDHADLRTLNDKINALLPPQYQNCYDMVKPLSMGSADLIYGPDGKVAWNDIWTSFCDLALAGGPPHRGKLLQSVTSEAVFDNPEAYQSVIDEITRGIWLVTELPILPRVAPGWIGIRCRDEVMASWLVRAIVAENVNARQKGNFLYLPAGPHFRLEKEIKNVVTVIAKTYHYWTYHMPSSSWMEATAVHGLLQAPLLEEMSNAPEEFQAAAREITQGIQHATALPSLIDSYPGWVGVQCSSVEMAVWLLRAVIVENIVVRREENVLYLPANPKGTASETSRKVTATFVHAFHLWKLQQ